MMGGGGGWGRGNASDGETKSTNAAVATATIETYAFSHQSFADWITNGRKSEVFGADKRRGHERLAKAALDMKPTFVALTEEMAGEEKEAEENRMRAATARYLVQHGLRHAAEAGCVREAADELLLDFETLLARAAVGDCCQ